MSGLMAVLLSVAVSFRAVGETGSEVRVPEITVYGATPKSSTLDFVPTVSELSGAKLQRKKQSTIGETLSREVGVTSSQFGPNASRPVIRGLEGDRLRVLQNGTGVLDASSASPDHGVAVDPAVVERVEIVRGPAALLYGSNAIGGVVNMVTARIPESVPENVTGQAETNFSSTDLGRSAAVSVTAPAGRNWVAHVDGSARGSDDYHVPGYARTREERDREKLDPEVKGRVYSSFNRTLSQSGGGSYVFENGFAGASFSNYGSTYGTVAERGVEIRMVQQRTDAAAEIRTRGFIKTMRAKNTYSHYKHEELDAGVVGTSFRNDGDEARADFLHREFGGLTGAFGVQANVFRFSAQGDEAFLPKTDNQAYSAFVFEEVAAGNLRPSFGARMDVTRVKPTAEGRFATNEAKSFTGGSYSLGLLYQVTPTNALVLNGAYTERAPNYEELFADGRHVATAQNIRGDVNLAKERGHSAEFSWRHKGDSSQGGIGVFMQDFQNFIALIPTGGDDGDPEKPFDKYAYRAVAARFYGTEVEFRQRLPQLMPAGTLDLELKVDSVRGLNRSSGQNLPRITPFRETIGLVYRADRLQADVEVQRAEKQNLVAPGETDTAAYTLVNLGVEMPVRFESWSLGVLARVHNAFDVEARNHVSVLKDISPLPGRNFILGVRGNF